MKQTELLSIETLTFALDQELNKYSLICGETEIIKEIVLVVKVHTLGNGGCIGEIVLPMTIDSHIDIHDEVLNLLQKYFERI